MRQIILSATLFALAACGPNENATDAETSTETRVEQSQTGNLADSMASHDDGAPVDPALDIPDPEDRPIMQAQVVLDRQAFGPGVIDGKMGMSTENALLGFQRANDLEETGQLDEKTKQALARWDTIPATRVVRIPAGWGEKAYQDIPDDPAEQAEMKRLGYESLDEKLAERFHTTIDTLKALNPGGQPAGLKETGATASPSPATTSSPKPSPTATSGKVTDTAANDSYFKAGQLVRVPNIGADRIKPGSVDNEDWQATLAMLGVGSEQPEVSRVVVSKSKGTLEAYDGSDSLVALFTVTSGSSHDPLPLGDWKVLGVAHNPPFSYDPELFWDVPDSEPEQQLPPGPNGPVGVVWIDLSKEHYGIHGTSEPQTIGRAQSHGCVRLTNWDAARVAEMVSTGTKVEFVA